MITVVLTTRGKHESVDYASVHVFNQRTEAEDYCKENNSGKCKHWLKSEIVEDGIRYELAQPED